MSEGLKALINYFKANDLSYELDEENRALHSLFSGDNSEFRLVAAVEEEDDVVQLYAFVPTKAPIEKREAVAELCVRVSFGLRIGSFEFDMEAGEIRFHAGAPYPKGNLDESVIQNLIGFAVMTADDYYPAFASVLFAGVTAKEAASTIALEDRPPDEV